MNQFSMSTITDFTGLEKGITTHMSRVYSILTLMTASMALGSYLNVVYSVGGAFMSMFSFMLLLAFYMTPFNGAEVSKQTLRISILALFGFVQGLSIGPLIQTVLAIPNGANVVMMAVTGTAGIFACFSLSAMMAESRSMLFLGGMLGSAVTGLLFVGLFNFFLMSPFLFNVQLYLGLLVFSGYVIFDTQLILEKAKLGDKDYVGHALGLFIDLVAIFVRILIILAKKEKKKENR